MVPGAGDDCVSAAADRIAHLEPEQLSAFDQIPLADHAVTDAVGLHVEQMERAGWGIEQ